jgi:hypothetical protein
MDLKINHRRLKVLFVFLVLSFCITINSSLVFAQESQTQQEGVPKQPKVHNLNFEDELVEGGIQKPDLFYLIQRKNFNFKKLIRLRENFLPEMRETSDYLREGRSKN